MISLDRPNKNAPTNKNLELKKKWGISKKKLLF
jgi:hypothetical protein